MTKILKLNKQDKELPKINRELVSKLGNFIYEFEEVKSIEIDIGFKDNTDLSFNRDGDMENMDILMGDLDK